MGSPTSQNSILRDARECALLTGERNYVRPGDDVGVVCVVVAQKTQWRLNKLSRQVAMIHHDSDASVNLSKPLQKTRIRKREMRHGFHSYAFRSCGFC